MTRGPEIAVLVDELWESLGKKKQADGKAPCVLRKTFDFLCSLDDYKERLRATPDDFAYLPAEIIYEVVDADERVYGLSSNCLVDVEGFWGDFALKRIEKSSVWIMFEGSTFLKRQPDYRFQSVSFEEAQDHPIHCTEIDENSDFEQLRAVAPNLYESVKFTDVPHIPGDIISRIGNRFSSVRWLIKDNASKKEKRGKKEKPTENYMKPEVSNFLKRQLRSQYLRNFEIAALGIKQGQLDDLLIDFVKRPHFERLVLSECLVYGTCWSSGLGGYELSFQVIKEAYNSWISKTHFDASRQDINGAISKETHEQMKEYFQTNFEGPSHEVKHNSLPDATLEMRIYEKNEQLQFRMWCYSMQGEV